VFQKYAVSLLSDYAAAPLAGSSHDQLPKLNRLFETAKTPCLRGRRTAFLLALGCFLPGVTSSASGALRVLPRTVGSLALSGTSTATYPAVDTFSGSGALSSNWTNTTSTGQGYVSLAQNSGTVTPSVSGQQGLATYTGISFTNNQYAQAVFVTHSSSGGSTGVCVRMNAAGSGVCYLADWGMTYALANGAGTHSIGACPIPASGDTIQLLVVGTTYTCTDVTTGVSASATDTTYSSGSPAILVDQRRSTVYALAQFQADCSPSCGTGTAPPPATYPAVDTFSGSGALSSNWTNTTSAGQGYVSLAQNSSTVVPSVSGQQGLAAYTGISFTNNQYAQAVFVTHSSSGGSTGVCVRMNVAGSGVCYLADWGMTYALANGAGIHSIGACPIPASGDTIQLLVVGTTYTCTDVTTGVSASATDTTYSSGSPAILVDQRRSTVYALAQFQADCSPSCSGSSSPQLTVSATALSFGSVAVNTATTLSLTLTSTGTSPVTVNSAAITGSGFSIVAQSFPVTLNPNQSLTLQVQFDPTATGTASGQFTISSNSTTGGTAVVALSGTGVAANPQLTISATTLSFGSVTVNTPTTQSLTLTSSGTTPVTVNSAAITGAGFTIVGGSFPVTLNPTQTLALQIQFEPTTTGAVTGQLTISSNSTSASTAGVALSGTGAAAAYEVNLNWSAPANSPDPVAGYNIYRATGTGSFVLINSSPVSATAYVDSTVTGGATYIYEVMSVGSNGVQSVASSQITVTIP